MFESGQIFCLLTEYCSGIRTALYAQSMITLVLFAIAPETGNDSWWSTLVTALSLQLAGLANHQSISLYHAVLLTWLAFPAIIMSFCFYGIHHHGTKEAPTVLLVLTVLHICVFLVFADWVWITAPRFPCSPDVHVIVFGHRVRVIGRFRYIVFLSSGSGPLECR